MTRARPVKPFTGQVMNGYAQNPWVPNSGTKASASRAIEKITLIVRRGERESTHSMLETIG